MDLIAYEIAHDGLHLAETSEYNRTLVMQDLIKAWHLIG